MYHISGTLHKDDKQSNPKITNIFKLYIHKCSIIYFWYAFPKINEPVANTTNYNSLESATYVI